MLRAGSGRRPGRFSGVYVECDVGAAADHAPDDSTGDWHAGNRADETARLGTRPALTADDQPWMSISRSTGRVIERARPSGHT